MEFNTRGGIPDKLKALKQTVTHHKAPRIPQKLLRWYCKPELLEDIEGDIQEDFNKRYTRQGKRIARFYYLLDVIRFFRPFAVRNIFKTQINNSMFKLNTRIVFRNLAKHKLYSFINIAGLGIGIAACLIIAHYVLFQPAGATGGATGSVSAAAD